MAIARTPNSSKPKTTDSDRAAEAFISNAGKAPVALEGKTPVLWRVKNDFLARIDAAAKKAELPRLAWIRTVVAEALEAKGF